MNIPRRYIVICEGKSDRAYLLALQSLLDGVLRPPEGWDEAPVRFIPRPEPNGVKTGYYDEVLPAFMREKKRYPSDEVLVWVDADIYIRNEIHKHIGNGDVYKRRDKNIVPDFYFSYHKFEDFLLLHYGQHIFQKWKTIMLGNGHLHNKPLSRTEYAPEFQKVLPHYTKSRLPANLVNEEGLSNLRTNCTDPDVESAELLYSEGRSFAKFLVEILDKHYPILFS